jgi:hypothetical protein
MKKTITTSALIIGYFIMMSSLGIIASVPGHVKSSEKEIVRREIIGNIACPEFLTESGDVKAVVQVNADGTVKVDEINSSLPELKTYVTEQLENMKLKNTAIPEKFVLIIHFKAA